MNSLSGIMTVPFARPSLVAWEEMETEFKKICESGQITSGKFTRQFETLVEQSLGVRHAIAVSSGTAGLMLALKAVEAQGEIVLPSFTFPATLQAVLWAGCVPVFSDCEEGTYCLDPKHVESLISSRTSAVLPVYLYGLPPGIDRLQEICRKKSLKLIFDAASAMGAKYKNQPAGCFGDAEIFSLSPGKVVTAGEGGMVTTQQDALAEKIRGLRNSGKMKDGFSLFGLNARMSEFHALLGYKNFEQKEDSIKKRIHLIESYKKKLGKIKGLHFQEEPPERVSNGNFMVIFLDPSITRVTRDELQKALQESGIETKSYFTPPLHLLMSLPESLPRTEKASETCLALPLYEEMPASAVDYISEKISQILEGNPAA